ncbi:MAG: DUF2125 domain-containing protein [Proteobacteria bacterium]|nr:DUF2125 domain-containing protein [Pseudomonadota bacterium]
MTMKIQITGQQKRGLMTVAAIGAVAVVYGFFWNYLAGQYRAGIEQWVDQRRADGVEVGFSSLRVVGFPLKLEALLSDPAISGPAKGSDGARTWTWRGPLMLLQARPWAPDRAQGSAPGRHRLTVTGGAKPLDLAVDAGTLTVSMRFQKGRPAHAVVSARNLMVNDAKTGRIASLVRVQLVADQSGHLSIEANAITYPVAPVPGLGLKTARVAIKAQVKGGLPLKYDAETMAGWRDGGGTLEVSQLVIQHGPLGLEGDGTGALDASLQPIGAFSLRVRGVLEAVNRLEGAGIIKPRAAALSKSALGALTKSQGSGNGDDLKVPLSIQDGTFFVGPLAVAKVAVVRWPSAK